MKNDAIDRMESGYRILSQMIRTGEQVDGVVKNAMNAALALMLALDSGELDPADIGINPFLKFERTKEAAIVWVYDRFRIWYRDCYPVHDSFLALDYFMDAIRYKNGGGQKRDNEIREIITGISIEMAERKRTSNHLKEGLVKQSVTCVSKALSIESAFI